MDNSPKGLRKSITALEAEFHKFLRDAPWKKNEAGVAPCTAPKQEGDSAQGQVALPLQAPRTLPNRDQPRNPWYKTLNGWKTILEIIAIPFALGYAVVSYYQWGEAKRANDLTVRIFATGQRSLIKVDEVDPPITTAKLARVQSLAERISVSNVGKSLARNVTIECRTKIFAASTIFKDDGDGALTSYDQAIMLGGGNPEQFPCATTQHPAMIPVPLEDGDKQKLASGDTYIATFGHVTYSDEFGPHWTKFCFWHGISDTHGFDSRPCSEFNDIDHNP